ncbi:energy-coupling factor transporter transmembrane component T [Paenibacillus tengchongensis]|uniref:energy-coupling factor transporter transmembrane component T n=1 Tax=Paenibacillus tengchongensis TaxID=2608684 RepID=UPI00124D2DDD|nr:energy-coupling factor transporter transmembrane component T [Paenibacillus tengchongensis]
MRGGFGAMHPAVALVYYMGLLLFALLQLHPVFVLTQIFGLVLLTALQGQARLLRGILLFLPVALSVALLNPLFSHRGSHILFYLWDRQITLEAVLYGLMTMTLLLAVFILFISYNYNVTADKFMHLFAGLAPKTALLLWMALRFVPLFQRRLREITRVQRLRGIDVGRGSLRKRMADGMTLLKVLVSWSLEEALQTADSMKARGYGVSKRSSYGSYRMDRLDKLVLLWLMVCACVPLIGWFGGQGIWEVYPRLKPMGWGWEEGGMYAGLCLFVLTAPVLEGKEKWQWRSSRRKAYPSATPQPDATRFRNSLLR